MEISETKDVWLSIGNSDLTEGRGRPVILHVCESYETAKRLGKKMSVMGSDADVEKATAVKIGSRWLAPVNIERESEQDKELRIIREFRDETIKKMRDSGFTDEEIKLMHRGG
ncbi:hypothetical protein QT13_01695 [Pectobacterium brasiliense]|uniref:hypothetical protein n=1 Tax=Pectobacterium brasiliense TaxID=180957 RepID=UPI00057DB49D|nr:hypothetical protein [Pectobacterium brasiliense]KHS76981.1 hypothetical protein QT13_01695 [Pectobacterium brasiliense]